MRGLPLVAIVVGLAACSSGTSGPATPAPGLCDNDARAQKFVSNLAGTGTTGPLDIRLAAISPAPPVKGNNDWTLEVKDASGAPVDGLALDVAPYMPDHRHPSSIVPTVTASGSGRYDVSSLNLAMVGIWTVTVSVPADGGASASTVFTFCIED